MTQTLIPSNAPAANAAEPSRPISRLWLAGIALLLIACCPMPTLACITLSPDGKFATIDEESAVIVWDAKTHTEHFIRQAAFDTDASDFGFLVPTPTPPTLVPASANVFYDADRPTQPVIHTKTRTGYVLTNWLLQSFLHTTPETQKASFAATRVKVLSTQSVAGYDATVLRADDAAALVGWLKKHGYATTPASAAWLAPYTARHWAITAFKITKDEPQSPQVSSAVVRMSFQTPHPFFPYREPADQPQPNRLYEPRTLRVYLLSQGRMEGTKGLGGAANSWPAQTLWANALTDAQRGHLENALALTETQIPKGVWMTAFEDNSSPRPGTDDVYFQQSPLQSSVTPTPEVEVQDKRVSIPIELLLLIVAVVIFGAVRVPRRNRAP